MSADIKRTEFYYEHKKTLVAVIAAMLVAATLPCFAKGNVVTQWTAKVDSDTWIVTFYSDKTVEFITIDEDGDSDEEEGTYSGDTTKNGKISVTRNGNSNSNILEIVGNLMKVNGLVLTKVK